MCTIYYHTDLESIIVPACGLSAKVGSVGERNASLLPDLELPVLRDLPVGLVLRDGRGPLAVWGRA